MARQSSDRPNVIVFFTDQQRWDSSALHGNPLVLTPNYDRMAQRGTHGFNAFTCQPVCAPARASLQTGLYARQAGVFRNGQVLRPDQRTLAGYFKSAGYRTGYYGKWHLAERDPVPVEQRGGYDEWFAANVAEFCSEPYNAVLFDQQGNRVKMPGYRVDALTDAAIRYVDRNQDHPFFLFLSYLEPHFQNHVDDFPAPEGYRERYSGRWSPPDLQALGGTSGQHLGGYWGMIRRLDEALGRLLDALRSLDLASRTVLLYTSDHGCHFKTRNDEYKRSCHESSIRIPLAVQGPGFDGGGCRQELISLVDVAPTLLDAAGIPMPSQMQGQSFLRLNRGESRDWPEEVFVQISEAQVARSVRTHRWKYSVSAPDKDAWNDAGSDRYREEFLYDLESDPYELRNLIGQASHHRVAETMQGRLLRRMKAAGEEVPIIESAPCHPAGQRRVDPGEDRQ